MGCPPHSRGLAKANDGVPRCPLSCRREVPRLIVLLWLHPGSTKVAALSQLEHFSVLYQSAWFHSELHDLPRSASLPCRLSQRGHEHLIHTSSSSARLAASPSYEYNSLQISLERGASCSRASRRQSCRSSASQSPKCLLSAGVREALESAFAAADNNEAHWLTHPGHRPWAMPWPAQAAGSFKLCQWLLVVSIRSQLVRRRLQVVPRIASEPRSLRALPVPA